MSSPFHPQVGTRAAQSTDTPVDAEFEEVQAPKGDIDVIPSVTLPTTSALRERLGLLDEEAVASALGQQVRTLKHWRSVKVGPSYVKVGRVVFYLYDDVSSWLRAVRTVTTQTTEEQNDRTEA
jgi:hypothetical protein